MKKKQTIFTANTKSYFNDKDDEGDGNGPCGGNGGSGGFDGGRIVFWTYYCVESTKNGILFYYFLFNQVI